MNEAIFERYKLEIIHEKIPDGVGGDKDLFTMYSYHKKNSYWNPDIRVLQFNSLNELLDWLRKNYK